MTVASPPEPLFLGWTQLQLCGELLRRTIFWRDSATPASSQGHTHETSTSVSPTSSGTFPTKIPLPSWKRLSCFTLSWQLQQHPTPHVSSTCAPYTLSMFYCSSVWTLVNTLRHNHTGAPFSSNPGTYISTTKMASFHKIPRKSTSFAPVQSMFS